MSPDRKKKIKRIIAREGLIFMGVLFIFIICKYLLMFPVNNPTRWRELVSTIFLIPGTVYLIYALFRILQAIFYFIPWAIRTLRER